MGWGGACTVSANTSLCLLRPGRQVNRMCACNTWRHMSIPNVAGAGRRSSTLQRTCMYSGSPRASQSREGSSASSFKPVLLTRPLPPAAHRMGGGQVGRGMVQIRVKDLRQSKPQAGTFAWRLVNADINRTCTWHTNPDAVSRARRRTLASASSSSPPWERRPAPSWALRRSSSCCALRCHSSCRASRGCCSHGPALVQRLCRSQVPGGPQQVPGGRAAWFDNEERLQVCP